MQLWAQLFLASSGFTMSFTAKGTQKSRVPGSDDGSYAVRVERLTKDPLTEIKWAGLFESLSSVPQPTLPLPRPVLSLQPGHTA